MTEVSRAIHAPQKTVPTAALVFFAVALLAGHVLNAADVRHVVLVSVDGLAATYLDDPKADLPTLRELRQQGASAEGMITTFPSVTWPSHTSLITGTRPKLHGVLANTDVRSAFAEARRLHRRP